MTGSTGAVDALRVLHALPARFMVLLADGPRFTIAEASEAYIASARASRDEMLGRGLFEAFPDDHEVPASEVRALLLRSLTRVQEGGVVDRMPVVRYDVPARDGQPRAVHYWIPVNAPVIGADGRVQYIVHYAEDATGPVREAVPAGGEEPPHEDLQRRLDTAAPALMRYGEALRRSNDALGERESLLSSVFNNTPLLLALLDADGKLIFANAPCFGSLGFSREELIGHRLWDGGWLGPAPEARESVRNAVAAVVNGGRHEGEFEFWRPNGKRARVEVVMSPVAGAGNHGPRVLVSASDITEKAQIKAALMRSEHRLRTLMDNVACVIFRVEALPPYRVVYASGGIESLTGYPQSWFIDEAHPWQSVMLEEDRARVAAETGAQRRAGKAMISEYRIRRRDGSVRWVELRATPAADDRTYVEGTVFDIDARKRAEHALAESEEHFRHAIANVPSLLWTANASGEVDFVSEAVRALLGRAPEELLGDGWLDLLHPDDRDIALGRRACHLTAPGPIEALVRLRHAGGEYRTLQSQLMPRYDDQGRVMRWYGAASDVESLMRAQELLREQEAVASLTMRNAPTIVWRADPAGEIVFVSEGAMQYLGRQPAELLGVRWYNIVHPDDVEALRGELQHSLQTGVPFDARVRYAHATGNYRWFRTSAVAARDEAGAIEGWFGVATDVDDVISAQRRAEQATRAKSVFLSTMSHEIRTPLNAVLGFAGLLADTDLKPQQREFVNSIRASGDHLLGVINDILDISRLESGGVVMDRRPCAIDALVESSLDIVASQAAIKNIELISGFSPRVPPVVMVDGARLRQVLVNLLSNAVKFTHTGEVQVWVDSSPLEDGLQQLEFVVKDSGIGIAADQMGLLFRDFSQVDESITRRFGGTGLGLAICKRLVEAHDGRVTVESRVGAGSTFRFFIPARSAASKAPLVAADGFLAGRRLLVVDDNRLSLDATCSLLRGWGAEAAGLQDPLRAADELAAAAASGRSFDVVLLDHHMPQLDGPGLARLLAGRYQGPLLLMSGVDDNRESLGATGARFAAVLTKPIHRSALQKALGQVCASQAAVPSRGFEPAAAAPPLPPLRLLLVEDNLVNRKLAGLLLRKLGINDFATAGDGLEAVAAVLQGSFDVVLMDVNMPSLDGLEATRRIRAGLAEAQQPQVIAMTAGALSEDREACLAAGMDDYVPKPIDPAELTRALRSAAQRRGLIAQAGKTGSAAAGEAFAVRAQRIADEVLAGGGEMGALMRAMDWSRTPLGPVYTWPHGLRAALGILLSQKMPVYLWWGPQLIQFYNDAYRPILGSTKHPAALGQGLRECFSEIWPTLEPLIDGVMQRAEPSLVERGMLCLNRHGFPEEAYFTYGYSPIRDDSGVVAGAFVACTENTLDVLDERRSRLLLEVERVLSAKQAAGYEAVRMLIEQAGRDIPFLLIYQADPARRSAWLTFSAGIEADSVCAPAVTNASDPVWPLFRALRTRHPVRHEQVLPLPVCAPWPEAPSQALVVPLGKARVIVAGLSARLFFDDAYLRFVVRLAMCLERSGPAVSTTA